MKNESRLVQTSHNTLGLEVLEIVFDFRKRGILLPLKFEVNVKCIKQVGVFEISLWCKPVMHSITFYCLQGT